MSWRLICPKYWQNIEFPGRRCLFVSSLGFEKHRPQVSNLLSAWLPEANLLFCQTCQTFSALILMGADPITALPEQHAHSWPPATRPPGLSQHLPPILPSPVGLAAILWGPASSLLPPLLLYARMLPSFPVPPKMSHLLACIFIIVSM